MATLTAKLTLTSSNATSDTLNLTATDTLTTQEPAINVARISISQSAATEILTTAQALRTYVYIKNTDSTNFVKVSKKLNTNTVVVKAQIHAGGRGKGGGIKLATGLEEVNQTAKEMLGMKLAIEFLFYLRDVAGVHVM